jgi:hypothetical protein
MAIIVGQRIAALISSQSTIDTTSASGYIIHTFGTPGSGSFTAVGSGILDEVLVVGGGGGCGTGGARDGGGGGGSVLYYRNVPITHGVAYSLQIGTGGPTGVFGTPSFLNSNLPTITAPGGANGGAHNSGTGGSNPLGSGGGGAGPAGLGGLGAGVVGLGFPGVPIGVPGSAGGGGGAGGVASGSRGGQGVLYSITGFTTSYGGGGGGAPFPLASSINPSSTVSDFGLGGGRPYNTFGRPGCIILRYKNLG